MAQNSMHTPDTARANYDRLSRWYDLLAGDAEDRARDLGLDMLGIRASERVLEIGSGTGRGLVAIARSVDADALVCGIDLSTGMCGVARRRLDRAGLGDGVALCQGDATRLPFTPGSLNAIFMCFTLELFDAAGIDALLGECRRVLRADGRMSVVSMAQPARPNLMTRLYGLAGRVMPSVVDCHPIPVRAVLEAAGMPVLETRDISLYGLPVQVALAARERNLPAPC
jgi:ubiquinone/menaquinone biosynthesis C-methylase UbiE